VATTANMDAVDRQEALNQAAAPDKARMDRYTTYRNYLDGEQNTRLTDRALTYLQQRSGLAFCENFTETVRDVEADRLEIEAWDAGDDEDTTTWANDLWRVPQVGAVQGTVHSETIGLADGFVTVEWDAAAKPAPRPKLTWNDPALIKPVYTAADPTTPEYVVKVWNDYLDVGVVSGTARRMNLYFPDRVEKWYTWSDADGSNNAHWYPILDDGETTWPVSNLRPDGSPRGIGVFHFRVGSRGRAFGRSRIHGFLPFQDELNKQIIDLFWVMDTQSWGHRWVAADGDVDMKLAPGNYARFADKDARVGQWQPDDPRPALDAIEATLRRGAAKTRTPMHEMLTSGALPSGESLKTAEAGLGEKVADDHEDFTPTWAEVLGYCRMLHNDFGGGTLSEDEPIVPRWKSPYTRNEMVEAQTAREKHDLGVSARTLIAELGYDPEQEMQWRREENQAAMDNLPDPLDTREPTVPGDDEPGGTITVGVAEPRGS
jgi:hypothetical protein